MKPIFQITLPVKLCLLGSVETLVTNFYITEVQNFIGIFFRRKSNTVQIADDIAINCRYSLTKIVHQRIPAKFINIFTDKQHIKKMSKFYKLGLVRKISSFRTPSG